MKFIRDIISEKRAQATSQQSAGQPSRATLVLGPDLARPPVGMPERVMTAPPRSSAGVPKVDTEFDEDILGFDTTTDSTGLAEIMTRVRAPHTDPEEAVYDLEEDDLAADDFEDGDLEDGFEPDESTMQAVELEADESHSNFAASADSVEWRSDDLTDADGDMDGDDDFALMDQDEEDEVEQESDVDLAAFVAAAEEDASDSASGNIFAAALQPRAPLPPISAGGPGAIPRQGEALARLRAEQPKPPHTPIPAPPAPEVASCVDVPAPAVGRGMRRAGRVKTRLLGFNTSASQASDPFASTDGAERAEVASTPGYTEFPVGWLVVVKGPGRGSAFSLFNGVAQIGRGADQTVRLDFGDNSISRENHAAIAYDPEQRTFYLGHGGKANLVRLNNRPVLSTEELSNGNLIRIGETTLRFVALCGGDFDWGDDQKGSLQNVSVG